MVRVKTSAFTKLRTMEFVARLQNCVNLLGASPLAPTTPDLGIIQQAITNLQALEVKCQNGDLTVLAERNTARSVLTGLYFALCIWLDATLFEIPEKREVLISLGFVPTKNTLNRLGKLDAPRHLKGKPSAEPGAIELAWRNVYGRRCFQIEIADTADVANAVFRICRVTTRVRNCITGLKRGNFYSFRIRTVGARSLLSDASNTVTCMAG